MVLTTFSLLCSPELYNTYTAVNWHLHLRSSANIGCLPHTYSTQAARAGETISEEEKLDNDKVKDQLTDAVIFWLIALYKPFD